MILIDITEKTDISYYEILGISQEDISDLDEKMLAKKVKSLAKKEKKKYNKDAQRDNKEAEEYLMRINEAESCLKNKEKLEQYNKDLETGKGASIKLLRIDRIAPAFFWDRNVRFRIIERLIKEPEFQLDQSHKINNI